MRSRWLRFFPTTADSLTTRIDGFAMNMSDSQLTIPIPDKPPELTWWDWTVFLLHTAAEVEHALMVQYLYSSYSIGERPFAGSNVPPNSETLAKQWIDNLLMISKQEMAHLATVQNLLRFIGAPLNFEREDFPFRNLLYPFKFSLEPLTKTSLAKYVSAEMPEDPGEPDLISEILARATGAKGLEPTNRVGELYEKLISIFTDQEKLPEGNFRPHTAVTLQATHRDWARGDEKLLVRKISSRLEAIDALVSISEQGEGLRKPSKSQVLSHFEIFLQMYKEYPETENQTVDLAWLPTRRVPFNPNTPSYASTYSKVESSTITNGHSLLWAHLFNVRYRMLIMYLSHAFTIEEPMTDPETQKKTSRGHLRDWVFSEMLTLGNLGRKLVRLPLKDKNMKDDEGTDLVAAPPFELPYTLILPDRNEDRWQLHLSLIRSSAQLVEEIRIESGDDPILEELSVLDEDVNKSILEFQRNLT